MPGLSVYCKSLRARLLGRGKHKGVVCVFHNMLHYIYVYIYIYICIHVGRADLRQCCMFLRQAK